MTASLCVLLVLLASPVLAQETGTVTEVSSHWKTTPRGDRLIVSRVKVKFPNGQEIHEVEGGTLDGVTLETSDGPAPKKGQRVKRKGKTIAGSDDFVVTGRKWMTATVPYVVNAATPDLPPASVLTALQFGSGAWSTQASPSVRLVYAGAITGGVISNNGQNQVFFRPEAAANGALATTYWWRDSNNRMLDADVVFYDPYRFFVGTSGCNGGYYLEDVAIHEFGHVLGLSHSLDAAATMVSGTGACNMQKRSLAPDDIAGIYALYPQAPPVTSSALRTSSVLACEAPCD